MEMDLDSVLEHLYGEKEKLERAIAALEELRQSKSHLSEAANAHNRRGRKSMGAAEREQVSRRMKKYWAGRRKDDGEQHAEI